MTNMKAYLLAGITAALSLTAPISPAAAQTAEAYPMAFQAEPVARQLETVERGIATGPFRADWDSLKGFEIPEWFRDAKFGIFIHWGPYAVPGFANEWYSRNMYEPHSEAFTYHRNVFGPQSEFGYKDFIPMFTAERFDAEGWIDLFQRAGARYVIPVAEHCDGFAMYDSDMTRWDATEMGPKRDTSGELMQAARDAGMHFGLSSHRAEHWWWYGVGRTYDSDVNDPRFAGLYGPAAPRALPADPQGSVPSPDHLENWYPPNQQFLEDWLARTTEIIDKYQPEMIYLDWWTSAPAFEPNMRKLAAYYYNDGQKEGYGPAIAYKGEQFESGTALFDIERGKLDALRLEPWQTDTSISIHSWGFAQDDEYRTAKSLTQDLVDVVSKNGNLLLNVGPKADGTIPAEIEKVLVDMGSWLQVNGEAIYDTRPYKFFGEGPTVSETGQKSENPNKSWTASDFRFTTKGDTLYAIGMERPSNGTALLKTMFAGTPYLDREIAAIELVGGGALKWQQSGNGLEIDLPAGVGADMPYTMRIRFSS